MHTDDEFEKQDGGNIFNGTRADNGEFEESSSKADTFDERLSTISQNIHSTTYAYHVDETEHTTLVQSLETLFLEYHTTPSLLSELRTDSLVELVLRVQLLGVYKMAPVAGDEGYYKFKLKNFLMRETGSLILYSSLFGCAAWLSSSGSFLFALPVFLLGLRVMTGSYYYMIHNKTAEEKNIMALRIHLTMIITGVLWRDGTYDPVLIAQRLNYLQHFGFYPGTRIYQLLRLRQQQCEAQQAGSRKI